MNKDIKKITINISNPDSKKLETNKMSWQMNDIDPSQKQFDVILKFLEYSLKEEEKGLKKIIGKYESI